MLEPGSKISLYVGDTWITGTLIEVLEECGQDWLVIDEGHDTPRLVNSGYIQEIIISQSATVLPYKAKKLEAL